MGTTFKAWLIRHIEQSFGILFLLALFVMAYCSEQRQWPEWISSWWMLTLSFLVGVYPAIVTAKFTWNNFDEVISRSFKWRNSKVDLLDSRMTYTGRIFFATYMAILCVVYLIQFSIVLWA